MLFKFYLGKFQNHPSRKVDITRPESHQHDEERTFYQFCRSLFVLLCLFLNTFKQTPVVYHFVNRCIRREWLLNARVWKIKEGWLNLAQRPVTVPDPWGGAKSHSLIGTGVSCFNCIWWNRKYQCTWYMDCVRVTPRNLFQLNMFIHTSFFLWIVETLKSK